MNAPVRAAPVACAPLIACLLLAGCTMAAPRPPAAGSARADAAAPIAPALAAAAQALLHGAAAAAYARGAVRADAHGRLQVYVRVAAVTPALLQALRAAGLERPEAVAAMGVVQGWVAPARLAALARVPGVVAVEPPRYARTR